ncbi:hypothetical protein GIB67_037611 [Kingdonia uniflora]|uniref:Uncharacterized protein n=1 Tax=Kingdonia uniflora TaxID=39325 RepID=A0A7J7LSP3_9MAGN|nr:hypothetical protein GIB67_037611 [Kingdonia uniflora]
MVKGNRGRGRAAGLGCGVGHGDAHADEQDPSMESFNSTPAAQVEQRSSVAVAVSGFYWSPAVATTVLVEAGRSRSAGLSEADSSGLSRGSETDCSRP